MPSTCRRPLAAALCAAALVTAGGCARMLDQNRAPVPMPAPSAAASPTTNPVATADRGQEQPLPGLTPPPKPFIATDRFKPSAPPARPSTLLLTHELPDAPVPLSEYGRQPTHGVDDFPLGPGLTGAALSRRFGPPAGVAGIDDPWVVYRLTHDREMWLRFAGGDGPLIAADLVRAAEDGYVRDRLYPAR